MNREDEMVSSEYARVFHLADKKLMEEVVLMCWTISGARKEKFWQEEHMSVENYEGPS